MNNTPEKEAVPPPQGARFSFKIILFMLFVVALGIAGSVVQQRKMAARFSHLEQQTDEIAQLLKENQILSESNKVAITHVLRFSANGNSSWALNEAEYLVTLAHFVLQVEHNVPLGITLLKTADMRIERIHNPKLFPIRKMLAQDISALQAIPTVDTVGLYLRLQALDQEVSHLPLATDRLYEQHASVTEVANNAPGWKRALQASWEAIKQVLIIRHHDQDIAPLLSPHQHALLNLNLHVLFAQAEWAVLQKQGEVYQRSIQDIQDTVKRYFVVASQGVKDITQSLSELAKIDVAPKLPDMSNAVFEIRQFAESQVQNASQDKTA